MASTPTTIGVSQERVALGSIEKFSVFLLSVVLAIAGASYGGQRFRVRRRAKARGPEFVQGEVLVKFKAGVNKAAIAAVHRRHGTATIYTSPFARFKRVRTPKGKTVAQMVAALRKEPSVEYAEPNSICHAFMIPNDPYYPDQWHLDDSSQSNPYGGANGGGINVEPAWDVSQGEGVIVAVIDTGVAYEDYHGYKQAPDLANTSFVAGYDFVGDDTHPNDDDGHGTHVTGTIAQSTNNATGVAGVAFKCSIMPVKVLNKRGIGTAATVAQGIYFAADNGAKVINMSLGWPVTNGVPYDPGDTVRNAVAYAYNQGVTIVCASGNDGQDAVGYPAAYDDYCIAVGATRYDETRPAYSNYGSSLDIVAPGGDVGVDQNNDTYADGVLQNTFGTDPKDFGYWFYEGTSMAAPHLSGVAALIIALGVTDPDDVRFILESSAEDKGDPGWDSQYGHGLVDALAAVLAAGPPNQPPTVSITTPAHGATFETGATITFAGTATDPEDQDLSSTIEWTSDRDGLIGTGASIDASLSDGAHVITASVTDSGGATATAAVTIGVDVLGLGAVDWGDNYRWRDIAENTYSSTTGVRSYAYTTADGACVFLDITSPATTFVAQVTAGGLKPNFAYQLKLNGKPTQPVGCPLVWADGDDAANEVLGYNGRWYWKKVDKLTDEVVEESGAQSVPDSDYELWKAQGFQDQDYWYLFEGYLLFDYFVTDENGDAEKALGLDSSYHVLWKESQRTPLEYDSESTYHTLTTGSFLLPWYDQDPSQYTTDPTAIYAEWEPGRPTPGNVVLPEGAYKVRLFLTEESFHSPWDDTEGGYWQTVMAQDNVQFTVEQPIAIDSVTLVGPANVPKYGKVELLVALSNVAATEYYDPDPSNGGIDLRATFTGPSGAWDVNGFYDGADWRIRFAPDAEGGWTYSVTVTDTSGTDTSTTDSFTCVASAHKGWARIDGNYLRFSEDNSVFFGVGHNTGWQDEVREPELWDMASRGENLLSFWLAAPWKTPTDVPERAPIENADQGLGDYNQTACAYLDDVVADAEGMDIYLLPTIWSHGQLRYWNPEDPDDPDNHPWGTGWWDNNAYDTVCSATDFFKTTSGGSDTEQWRLQQNFYRYLIARWGYSRAILGWAGLCEIEGTTGFDQNPSQAEAWCLEVQQYFRANDPFRDNGSGQYPIGFSKSDWWGDAGTWGGPFDLRVADSYKTQDDDVEVAQSIADGVTTMRALGVPAFHTEFGGNLGQGATQPAHLHNGIWAGAATGAAMTPLLWTDLGDFPKLIDPTDGEPMRRQLEILAEFMVGVDYLIDTVPATVDVDDSDCRGWGMRTSDRGYAWIQNKAGGTIGGQTVTIEALTPGNYVVAWFDVWSDGQTPVEPPSILTVAADGILTAAVPTLAEADIACKFVTTDPTRVHVELSAVRTQDGRVMVEWQTRFESGTVGFYLLRRDRASGRYRKVSDRLLPALLHSPRGGTYRLVDPQARLGVSLSYKLVEVEARGRKRTYGPFVVLVDDEGSPPPAPAGAKLARGPEGLDFRGLAHRPSDRAARRTAVRRKHVAAGRITRPKQGLGGAVKIGVKERGLYYLAAPDIAESLGVPVEPIERAIARARLSLSCQGREVAYLPDRRNAGIYFCGQSVDSIYTDENVYWLRLGRGALMRVVHESGTEPETELQTFADTVHVEKDRYPAPGLFDDPEADIWLWDWVLSGAGPRVFSVPAADAAETGTATLTVLLKGATDTAAEPDHHAVIALNGRRIGEARWDGMGSCTVALTFAQELLVEGANAVTVEGVLDAGVPYSFIYVDSMDLTYQRRYRAVGDSLLCRGDDNLVVTIDGFTQATIFVLEVTDPDNARFVDGATVDEDTDGTYRVSFAPEAPESVYLALTSDAVKTPASLTADVPSRLGWWGNRADYVVIAPGVFKEPVQPLAEHRRAQRHQVMVVDLEDIYDEFNHGLVSPKAIRSFLACAGQRWRRRPKYVVLAGKGTYDYKDNLGCGDNLLPPLLTSTAYGLFASDGQFAPGVAIGRLPAVTPDELAQLVQKIIAYERAERGWAKRVLMLADDPDGGGDFPADSDDIATLVPAAFTLDKIYLSELPIAQARERLMDRLNDGAALVNYMGHGGLDRLASEGLLTAADVGSLVNGDRLPVVTALTCAAGRFAMPGYVCLGETLLLRTGGGAIAFWGPSGLSLNDRAKILGQGFFKEFFRPGRTTLGGVVLGALRSHRADDDTSRVYNLLGDPALRVRPAR